MSARACLIVLAVGACGFPRLTPLGQGDGGESGSGIDAPGTTGDGSSATQGTPIHVEVVDRPDSPSTFNFLAAYQDGTQPWQLAPAPTDDTYAFNVFGDTWGFTWTCSISGTNIVTVDEFAVAEKTDLTLTVPPVCTDRLAPAVTINGAVLENGATTGSYILSIGNATTTVAAEAGVAPPYSLQVPTGTYDLVAAYTTNAAGEGDATAVVVSRAVPITSSTSINFNFATATADTNAGAIGNPTGISTAKTVLYTATGTVATINDTTADVEGLPALLALSSDVYDEYANVITPGGVRSIERYVAAPAAYTYTEPAAFGGVAHASGDTPYPTPVFSWTAYPGAVGYQVQGTQGTVMWHVDIGAGAAAATSSVQIPDLSALPGWSTALQWSTGTSVVGTCAALYSSAGVADFPPLEPGALGTLRTFSSGNFMLMSP